MEIDLKSDMRGAGVFFHDFYIAFFRPSRGANFKHMTSSHKIVDSYTCVAHLNLSGRWEVAG